MKPADVLALDEPALRREIASPAQRHSVAALKHAEELPRQDPPSWARMLCSGDRFVEAIFVGDVTVDRIDELRLGRDEVQRLSDLAFDAMMGTLPLRLGRGRRFPELHGDATRSRARATREGGVT